MLQKIVTLMTAALITGGAFSLQADMAGKIEVNVPFDFIVGQKAYKAGSYNLIPQMAGVFALRDADGSGRMFILTQSVSDATRQERGASLVFNRYGDKHYLSQIWGGGKKTGQQLPKSAAEREQLVRIPSPSAVEVASRTR